MLNAIHSIISRRDIAIELLLSGYINHPSWILQEVRRGNRHFNAQAGSRVILCTGIPSATFHGVEFGGNGKERTKLFFFYSAYAIYYTSYSTVPLKSALQSLEMKRLIHSR